MGGVDHPVPHLWGEVHQRVVGRGGLRGEDVEARAPQPAFDQRLTDRQVVQKIAPGGVDEDGPGPDPLQEGGVYHASGLGGHSAVEGDQVAAGKQLLQREIGDTKAGLHLRRPAVGRVVEQGTAEGPQTAGHRLGDVPKAHQAHGALPQLRAAGGHDPLFEPDLPPLPHGPVARDPEAQGHEHEHHGHLRGGGGVAPLVVADEDGAAAGGLQVDGVIGHPLGVDQPQAGHPVHEGAVHRRDGVNKEKDRVGVLGEHGLQGLLPGTEYQLQGQGLYCMGKIGAVARLTAPDQNFHGERPPRRRTGRGPPDFFPL